MLLPTNEVAEALRKEFTLPLPVYHNEKQLLQALAEQINQLIQTDFSYLVSVLYRLDVSEAKLKELLKEQPRTDAGLLIAELIVKRQAEKMESRKRFGGNMPPISEEEKW